MIPAIARSSMV